jgi:hypothetical protein
MLKGSDDGLYSGLLGFWTLSIVRYFVKTKRLRNKTFRKLGLLPSSCEAKEGEGGDDKTYSVGPLRKS